MQQQQQQQQQQQRSGLGPGSVFGRRCVAVKHTQSVPARRAPSGQERRADWATPLPAEQSHIRHRTQAHAAIHSFTHSFTSIHPSHSPRCLLNTPSSPATSFSPLLSRPPLPPPLPLETDISRPPYGLGLHTLALCSARLSANSRGHTHIIARRPTCRLRLRLRLQPPPDPAVARLRPHADMTDMT